MTAGIPPSVVEHVYDSSVTFQQGHPNTGEVFPPQKPKKKYEQQKVLVYDEAPQELKQEKILAKIKAGADGRQRISQTTAWPNGIHAQLTMLFDGVTYGGSGVMIGPQHALTCGHNVYNSKEKRWAERISVFPGLNDDHAPFGKAKVVKVYVYSNWTNEGDKKFDIALLILNHAIGKYTGWGGILSLSDQEVAKEEVHITGYPGDKGLKQMWSMNHKVKPISAEDFEYEIDTYAGQSGSAIWVNKWTMPLILGVHTLGGDAKNSGVRLSAKKLADLFVIIASTHKLNKSSPAQLALPKIASPVDPASSASKKKVPLNREGRGRALLEAAAQGDQAFVEQLLSLDTDVNAKNLKGETALMLACENKHETIADTLVDNGAVVDAERENGERAIEIATRSGLINLVQKLVREGAKLTKEIQVVDRRRNTRMGINPALLNESKHITCPALLIAAGSGNLPLLTFLIDHGINLRESEGYDYNQGVPHNREGRDNPNRFSCFRGGKALVAACENGHESVAMTLLDMFDKIYVDMYSLAVFLCKALKVAYGNNHEQIIRILGEKASLKLSGWLLWDTIQIPYDRRDWKTVILLLNRLNISLVVEKFQDNETYTAGEKLLISACQSGEISVISLLLHKGMDLKRGMRFTRVSRYDHEKHRDVFVEWAPYTAGAAALQAAQGKEGVIQLLRQHGATDS